MMTLLSLSLCLSRSALGGWASDWLWVASNRPWLFQVSGCGLLVGAGSWVLLIVDRYRSWVWWVWISLSFFSTSLTLLHLPLLSPPPSLICCHLTHLCLLPISSYGLFVGLDLWVFVGFMVDFVCLDFGFCEYFRWW